MSYIFDSSSIFKAIKERTIEFLVDNYTLELARYELGNVLWKECVLYGRISNKELMDLIKSVKDIFGIMRILAISCHEEDIMNIAGELKLTFYDASYVYYAKKDKLILVTEDSILIEKVTPHIKILKLGDLIKK